MVPILYTQKVSNDLMNFSQAVFFCIAKYVYVYSELLKICMSIKFFVTLTVVWPIKKENPAKKCSFSHDKKVRTDMYICVERNWLDYFFSPKYHQPRWFSLIFWKSQRIVNFIFINLNHIHSSPCMHKKTYNYHYKKSHNSITNLDFQNNSSLSINIVPTTGNH